MISFQASAAVEPSLVLNNDLTRVTGVRKLLLDDQYLQIDFKNASYNALFAGTNPPYSVTPYIPGGRHSRPGRPRRGKTLQ